MNRIDGILWINLDSRTDRRSEMEGVLQELGMSEKAERFSAIARPPPMGILGCGLSHLSCLKLAKERGWKNVLIFEDDFQPLVSPEEFWTSVHAAFQHLESCGGYDVVMLAHHLQQSEPFGPNLLKVHEVQTASAYIVHMNFYDSLIELYEWAFPLLEKTAHHWIYANDQVWKRLQPNARWYAVEKRLGFQRPSYSDNSEMWMDYGV